MSIHSLTFRQELSTDLQTAWKFFSDPNNLARITPASMQFKVPSEFHRPDTYAGQIICYRVSPLWNIPMTWVTEITHVNAPHFFVDEQRKGPYKFWHHQHHFEETENGVLMRDILHYEIPFGIIGDRADAWLVRKKVMGIFEFRKEVLENYFPRKGTERKN